VEKQRKVLVSGGSGFIGTHLVRRLVGEGHDVYVLDNNSTSTTENISDLIKEGKIKFFHCDISSALPANITKIKFDRIYNLACPASPKYFYSSPIEVLRANVFGISNLLELAKHCGARFFQASTSEVYGSALKSPQDENYWGNVNPYGSRACYDEGKRCAEAFIYAYKTMFNLDVRIARFFNTYGPCMTEDDGRAVSNFITQALNNKNLTIYGDGLQTRSFCYVDDLVNGIELLMNIETPIDGPVNLGNDTEFTILELATLVLSKIQSGSQIEFLDALPDDPTQRRPDINKARKLLDYNISVSLSKGLDKTIEYFMSRQKIEIALPSFQQMV